MNSKKLKLACIAIAVTQALNVSDVNAATIIVDTNIDSSASDQTTCTLRDAITSANNDSLVTGSACIAGNGADVIEFHGLANPTTITLTSQLPLITSNITINGTGRDSLAISGADSYVMFRNDAELTLSNLTLRDGFFGRERAAAIESYGESLVLESLNIIDNGTSNGQPNGNVGITIISRDSERFTLSNSLVSNNASRGAIISSSFGTSESTISNSTITLNNAGEMITSGARSFIMSGTHVTNNTGTGITLVGGRTTIKTSNVSGNSGTGAVVIGPFSLDIIDSTISNNDNGVFNYGTAMNISGSTISGNSPNGGIFFYGYDPEREQHRSISISNSSISGNFSGDRDGGGASLFSQSIKINNTTFSGNESNGNGGGLFLTRESFVPIITNSIFTGNTAVLGAEIATVIDDPSQGPVSTNNIFGSDLISISSALSNFVPGERDILATSDELGLATSEIILGLSDNGGGTLTHALAPNSPAIDQGFACEQNDQRGEIRGALCDIGAFEFNVNDQSEIDYYLIPLENEKTIIFGL